MILVPAIIQAQIKIGNLDLNKYSVTLRAIESDGQNIAFLAADKEKGFLLKAFETDGKELWSSEAIPKNEIPVKLEYFQNTYRVFTSIAEYEENYSKLSLRIYNSMDGKLIETKMLREDKIEKTLFNKTKAELIADENLRIASLRHPDVEAKYDFRYFIDRSTNGHYYLLYRYDFSKESLYLNYQIMDSLMNLVKEENLMIDDNKYLYESKINNYGDVFVSYYSGIGDIEVLRFPLKSDDFDLLHVTAENSVRDDLTMHFGDGLKVYLACKSEIDENFYGALYMLMDFEELIIERVHFERMPEEFKDIADSIFSLHEYKHYTRDWSKFNLTDFRVFNDNELLLVYELMDLRHSGHVFNEIDFTDNLLWHHHKTKISSGPVMIFSFDQYDELRWSKYIYKEHVSHEMVFPTGSSFHAYSPKEDQINFQIADKEGSYSYHMDYVYNNFNEVIKYSEDMHLIPSWSVKIGGKNYQAFYNKEETEIRIIEGK